MEKIAKAEQFQEAMVVLALCVYEPNNTKLSEISERYRHDPNMELLVERKEEKIIGITGIEKQNDNTCEIKHIAVIPEYRKKGIARNMIEFIINRDKLKTVFAETDIEAVDFYIRCGFLVTSLGEKYQGTERFRCIKTG